MQAPQTLRVKNLAHLGGVRGISRWGPVSEWGRGVLLGAGKNRARRVPSRVTWRRGGAGAEFFSMQSNSFQHESRQCDCDAPCGGKVAHISSSIPIRRSRPCDSISLLFGQKPTSVMRSRALRPQAATQ